MLEPKVGKGILTRIKLNSDREKAYRLAQDFVLSSLRPSGGSAAFFSRILYPFTSWSESYPETSGYLIPTLFDAGCSNEAVALADWIVSLQYDDGGLPGGFLKKGNRHERSVFNTAQMLKGLHRAANETDNLKYREAALKAGRWLMQTQNSSGVWTQYNYQNNFSPSYYSRVAWPMLLAAQFDEGNEIRYAAIRTLDHIQSKVLDNHFIEDSGFAKGGPAFLHTIAYTIRGFLESAILLDRDDYWATGYNLAHKLFRDYELSKRLGGAYFEDGRKVGWYRCLTGEAQLCIIWLLIAEHNNDPRFVNTSSKMIDQLCSALPAYTLLKRKGGMPGSKPYYGRYIAFRQPNWATKFFMDALFQEEKAYRRLSASIEHRLIDS